MILLGALLSVAQTPFLAPNIEITGTNSINISWAPRSQASPIEYSILRKTYVLITENNCVSVTTVSLTTSNFFGELLNLQQDITYYFKIRACDNLSNCELSDQASVVLLSSPNSSSTSCVPPTTTSPPPPTYSNNDRSCCSCGGETWENTELLVNGCCPLCLNQVDNSTTLQCASNNSVSACQVECSDNLDEAHVCATLPPQSDDSVQVSLIAGSVGVVLLGIAVAAAIRYYY